jgi:hypothetical protein
VSFTGESPVVPADRATSSARRRAAGHVTLDDEWRPRRSRAFVDFGECSVWSPLVASCVSSDLRRFVR